MVSKMKNKHFSTTSLLIILLLPLITIIGLATWYITTNVNTTPEYSFSDVVKYYLNNKEMTYNGSQAILNENLVDCTIKYKKYDSTDEAVIGSPINAGIYTIIVTDTETNESVEVKYTINPKPLDGAIITLEEDSFIYLGTGSVTPTVTKVVAGKLLLTVDDYDVSYSNNTGVGTGLVIITGKGNFTGTQTKEFAIVGEEKDMIIELSSSIYSMEYDKEEFEFGDMVVKSGETILTNYKTTYSYRLNTESTFTEGKPINAGAYVVQVTVSKQGYKDVTASSIVTITQREIQLLWTDTETVIYDGLSHKPNVEATNIIEGDDVSISISLGSGFIKASTYTVSVQGLEGNDKNNYKLPSNSSINYTISPRPITLKTEIYEMNYDSSKRTWDQIKASLKNKAVFIDNDGKTWNPTSYEVSGMYDGSFGYGDSSSKTEYMKQDGSNAQDNTMVGIDSSYTNVVGSTYLVTYKVTDSNFTLQASGSTNLFKYKTAKVGSTYYTIEEAISASGNISFPGDSSGVNTYVYTAFCNLTDSEGYPYSRTQNLNGKRLVVSCKDGEDSQKYSQSVKSGNVYSALYIPKTITLNLNSSAELLADATIGFSQPDTTITCNRGVVFNNGTINLNNGCTLNAYGYVKGNGLVEMKSGSNTVDCMHTYDWPGGNAARNIYSDVLPTNAWSAHNISCTSKINAGAIYGALIYVYMDIKLDVVDAAPIATLIGSTSTSNCLFKGKSGYVLKKAIPATSWAQNSANYKNLYFVNGTNQQKGQRDDVKICGEYEDSTLKIGIKFSIISVNLETNTDKPATIGFMDITVVDGATFNLNKSDYLFFPGSTLKIEKGGTVNIGANVDVTMLTMSDFSGVSGNNVFTSYCQDKVDSKAIINGNLTVNGNIGGLWTTEEAGAIINASNGAVSSSYKMFTSYASPYYTSGTKTSTGNIDGTITNLQKMSYVSTGEGSYHWTAATNVKTFTLHFYDGGTLLETKNIQVVNGNTYTISGNEYVPTKEFYDFVEWKLSDGTLAAGNILTDGTNNEINLYASWTETEYSFSYMAGYGVDEEGNINYVDATYENIISSFKYSDFKDGLVLDITTTASYEGKSFIGWYVGVDSSIGRTINSITIDQLRMFIEQYPGISIPLYCEFTDEKVINVKYTTEIGTSNKTIDSLKSGETTTLPDMDDATYSDYINNNQYNKYFVGWRVQGTTDILSAGTTISYSQFTEDVVFEAVWNDKVEVTIDYDGGSSTDILLKENVLYYYAPNSTIYLGNSPSKTGYNFNKWTVSSGSVNNNAITIGSSNAIIKAIYTIQQFTITVKNSQNRTVQVYICYDGDENNKYDQKSLPGNGTITYSINYGRQIKVYSYYDNSYKGFLEDDWYTVTADKTYTVSRGVCLVEGTLISLANGSIKKVEDLNGKDLLLVFNHETGKLDKAYAKWLIHKDEVASKQRIIYLIFADGTEVGIVSEHGFFDKDKLEYVYINEDNINDYIGHNFYTINNSNNSIKLISYRIEEKVVRIYSPISNYHMNCFANGMLTISNFLDGFINIFKLDENMKYNEQLMKQDLRLYGESTIEDFLTIADEELIRSFPYKYVNVSIGKGKITYEEIEYLVKKFLIDKYRL